MKKLSKEDINIIKKSFKYLKAYKTKTIVMILITIVTIILGMLQPLLFGKIVDEITQNKKNKIIFFLIILTIIAVSNGILTYTENILLAKISNGIELDVRNDMFKNFINMECKEYLHINKGGFIEKIDQDSKVFAQLLLQSINSITSDIFGVVFIGVLILSISAKLSLILIIFFPINSIIYKYYGTKLRKINFQFKNRKDKYLSFINELLLGFKVVKIFQAENFLARSHNNKIKEITNIKMDAAYIYAGNELVIKFISVVGYLIVTLVGIYGIFNKEITLGQFIAFNSYSTTFTMSLFALAKLNFKVQEALVSIERVFSIDTYSNKQDIKCIENKINFNSDIVIENLCFSYENKKVLKNLTFTIYSKKINAIVGPSGCGKSTLLDIIMGIYDDYTGTIKVGQTSYREIHKKELFKKAVLVNQEEFLLTGTIRENLLLGNDKIDEDKMAEMCKMVNIHNFIANLPNKYDTMIGENGIKVSIGQKQRLTIARGLIKGASIYLFDEITSGLDGESEKHIIGLMKKLSAQATVVIVSHKKRPVLCAENIIVLNDGKIECLGSQEYVMRESNVFNNIFMEIL